MCDLRLFFSFLLLRFVSFLISFLNVICGCWSQMKSKKNNKNNNEKKKKIKNCLWSVQFYAISVMFYNFVEFYKTLYLQLDMILELLFVFYRTALVFYFSAVLSILIVSLLCLNVYMLFLLFLLRFSVVVLLLLLLLTTWNCASVCIFCDYIDCAITVLVVVVQFSMYVVYIKIVSFSLILVLCRISMSENR